MQHFERFKPLDNRLYDPWDKEEQREMYAIIDKKYEELYEKHKHKGLGEFYPPPSKEPEQHDRTSDNSDVIRGVEALKGLG